MKTQKKVKKYKFLLFQGKGLGSGHKTLLYGNAILLRHSNSDMVWYSPTLFKCLQICFCFSISRVFQAVHPTTSLHLMSACRNSQRVCNALYIDKGWLSKYEYKSWSSEIHKSQSSVFILQKSSSRLALHQLQSDKRKK